MPYSEKVREIKRLQDEILKHHRPADIKRLDAILQEGPLEQKRADRERNNKALEANLRALPDANRERPGDQRDFGQVLACKAGRLPQASLSPMQPPSHP
jgi:hypothetical protein